MRSFTFIAALGLSTAFASLATAPAWAADVPADPSDYLAKLATLQPGDVLQLAAGDYLDGLQLFDMDGMDGAPIVIAGPTSGAARFVGRSCCNTSDIRNSSYITLRNLLFDGDGAFVDAIKAGGDAADYAHHITIEGCTIVNHTAGQSSQQVVGISTKIVAWDWVIRGNTIGDPTGVNNSAGTGLYLGNSDGTRAFIGGIIEGNLIVDTLGYNMQIKHQQARESVPGVPQGQRSTIIRHNVFIKDSALPSPSGARPNLLVSGYPDSGPGSDDYVQIYGNFFYERDASAQDVLFQGSGRMHIHDNLFVNSPNEAMHLIQHQGKTVIDALIYHNTVYQAARGLSLSSTPSGLTLVAGNAMFTTQEAFTGVTQPIDNITGTVAEADAFFNNASTALGAMDFYPVTGSGLKGSMVDLSSVASDVAYNRDFNGAAKDFSYRGAYHGEGTNNGWQPDATLKPLSGEGGGGVGGGNGGGATTGATSSGSGAGASGGGSSNDDGGGEDDEGCGCMQAGGERAPTGGIVGLLGLLLAGLLRRRD